MVAHTRRLSVCVCVRSHVNSVIPGRGPNWDRKLAFPIERSPLIGGNGNPNTGMVQEMIIREFPNYPLASTLILFGFGLDLSLDQFNLDWLGDKLMLANTHKSTFKHRFGNETQIALDASNGLAVFTLARQTERGES